MPVTTPSAYAERFDDPDHFAHVLEHLFAPAIQTAGLTVIPPSVLGAALIHAEIIENLEQADLVLCDLSTLNPNVFFELGIRISLDRPVALVKDSRTAQIPFDLAAINTFTYDCSLTPWTLGIEISRLADHLKNITENSDSGNSMWRYFGLTKRATPSEIEGNPMQAKLDLIISEITKLQVTPTAFGAGRPGGSAANTRAMRARYDTFEKVIRAVLNENGITQYRLEGSPFKSYAILHIEGHLPDKTTNTIMNMGIAAGYEIAVGSGTLDEDVRLCLVRAGNADLPSPRLCAVPGPRRLVSARTRHPSPRGSSSRRRPPSG